MDLLHLVDRLEKLIAEAQKMPIGNRVIIDRRRLLDLIDQMRISVPQEVREARELVSNRDRILRDAEEESRIIVARAQETASHLVEDHIITDAARERAQEIADEAELRLTQRVEQANDDIQIRIEESRDLARQQMQAADDYAAELLHRLDRQLQAFVGSVQAGIQQVEPERELPPAPYPGEFDPGPSAPGNFRSDDAIGLLPEDERYTDDLTLTRHELPDTPLPQVALPELEPEPAPVVMTEGEPEDTAAVLEEPVTVDQTPAPSSRFGSSIWGRSETPALEAEAGLEPEAQEPAPPEPPVRSGFATSVWGRSTSEETPAPQAEPEPELVETRQDSQQIAASTDSVIVPEAEDATEESALAEPEVEPEAEPEPEFVSGGGGPFSSLFNRPAAETPPPPAPSSGGAPSPGGPRTSSTTNLPGGGGRLPGAGSVPPPTPAGSRFGLFSRRDQPAASVGTDEAPAVESSEANGGTFDEPVASEQLSSSTTFGPSLGDATPAAANGEFEDLLARARETAEPLSAELPEDLASDPDSDEPAVVIDDFDHPPLDDDPIRGSDSSDDRPPANGSS